MYKSPPHLRLLYTDMPACLSNICPSNVTLMASPVCAHVAVLGVVNAGLSIANLWKLLWTIYCFMQGQNVHVCMYIVYIHCCHCVQV